MNLFEYIKSQLPQMPNSAIMKQMGASEELIDYVKETPWNTNLNIIETFEINKNNDKVTITFDMQGQTQYGQPDPITVNKGETITVPDLGVAGRWGWGSDPYGASPYYPQGTTMIATESVTLYWSTDR